MTLLVLCAQRGLPQPCGGGTCPAPCSTPTCSENSDFIPQRALEAAKEPTAN